ncbi:MAG: HDOD domain-containing protein [Candidatus Marinimicrobia bacterium]|nr:HDOD domain-containing protein [Candidatus Neomarinimicrobiota bacterium]
MVVRGNRSPEYYREQVFSLTNLPTLPIIATEILRSSHEDNLSVNQLLPIIEKDPPLAMKVLKIANSAYYGLKRDVKSLRHAIIVIGMRELSNVAISFSVIKDLSHDIGGYHISWKQFWKHSVACGYVAQLIVDELGISTRSNIYTFGLLHDIGKLALYRIDPEGYIEALEFEKYNKCSSCDAEKEIFGVTHSDVGWWMAEKWKISEEIKSAVGYHHHPEKVSDNELKMYAALTQVADLVCNFRSLNFGSECDFSIPVEAAGWKILQQEYESLDKVDFESFVSGIEDELKTIKEMVGLLQT